ncbi:glutamine--fructose-6-phosphate transaminase (isomerizing) [Patescibacteria group bacterium]|nr:glutamine--fructose-6-phosphate transaminase (isomerizing) [Patescibacteria group bacterium]MBU1673373.1 glutamine--fructose-6-phosphate transaminase (isomerizing) [Patescibacteria group bacterium]MBU1963407.1 glutamine--fructose-6-phosphate transaminase (isomerizing) [Patescibacteria group bacterium]
MCGIIGYIGKKRATPILMEGLKKMEYRGYDSSGLAVIERDGIKCTKKEGKIENLEKELPTMDLDGVVGIAHTRWATHGEPSDEHAHPHWGCKKDLFLVHNGIIENYPQLKEQLIKEGHKIKTKTDTEILAHLIEKYYEDEDVKLEQAVQKALQNVKGTYGIAVITSDEPNKIVVARMGSPLVLGIISDGEYLIASDVTAILKHTRNVMYLEDGEMATVTDEGMEVVTLDNKPVEKKTEKVDWEIAQAEKKGYPHFMLKEIMEQPEVVLNAIRGRMMEEEGLAHLGGFIEQKGRLAKINSITIVACGTAYYAGMVGEYMIEEYAGIPVDVEYASEFRYKKPVIDENTAVIVITQSGETADTLAALREAKRKGALTLGIVNVVGSTIAREVDAGAYSHAGPEIGVASTKAFMSQLAILALVTMFLGRQRNMSLVMGQRILEELKEMPKKIEKVLKQNDEIKRLAKKYYKSPSFFFMGRKYNFPIALEGALKLKEISYIHAEGYGSGEMKHGPIALIDDKFPSFFLAPQDSVYEKVISNMEEIKARKGKIIAVATQGDKAIEKIADDVIYIPKTIEMLSPMLTVVPMQLFAYHVAVLLKRDVDQPRNLAKSVTVE